MPLLQPGPYELRVKATGFKLTVLKVVLTVGQVASRMSGSKSVQSPPR